MRNAVSAISIRTNSYTIGECDAPTLPREQIFSHNGSWAEAAGTSLNPFQHSPPPLTRSDNALLSRGPARDMCVALRPAAPAQDPLRENALFQRGVGASHSPIV